VLTGRCYRGVRLRLGRGVHPVGHGSRSEHIGPETDELFGITDKIPRACYGTCDRWPEGLVRAGGRQEGGGGLAERATQTVRYKVLNLYSKDLLVRAGPGERSRPGRLCGWRQTCGSCSSRAAPGAGRVTRRRCGRCRRWRPRGSRRTCTRDSRCCPPSARTRPHRGPGDPRGVRGCAGGARRARSRLSAIPR
jgi:hypothetical protein